MYEESHPDKEQQQQGGREIGFQEANWSVSSHRPHWGPEKLRDNNPLTYWQSDCPDAKKYHIIDLTFRQATIIKQVSMFIDFYQDESYTPKTVVIRGGNSIRDLVDVLTFECPQTVGWVNADISEAARYELIRVFKLQIVIQSTHLNGRDTHIRQVKVYSVLP
ncbi:galactose-binding like protein [Backusella circina FSU 941]|nr:galactose-binding like protein [Backusella circina FSU 941]